MTKHEGVYRIVTVKILNVILSSVNITLWKLCSAVPAILRQQCNETWYDEIKMSISSMIQQLHSAATCLSCYEPVFSGLFHSKDKAHLFNTTPF